ncbi:MAG: M23 family metallopeptidase [Elusimicrobiota bacterium]|jgi:hypothetical protein|nr:M23 family metallopeptidase [Elusimicrobiota bacterium]
MNRFYRYLIILLGVSSLLYVLSDILLSKHSFVTIAPQYKLSIDRIYLDSSYSLEKALSKAKIPQTDFKAIFDELSKHKNVYEINDGDFIDVLYDADNQKWSNLWYYPQGAQFYAVKKSADNKYISSTETLSTKIIIMKASAPIQSSLNETITDLGFNYEAFISFINILKWEFDFFTQTQKNDYVKIIYEANMMSKKNTIEFIKIKAVEYRNQNKTYNAFYFEPKDGQSRYFNSEARSLDLTYLMSPFYYPSVFDNSLSPTTVISASIDKNIIDYSLSPNEEAAVLSIAEGFVNMNVTAKNTKKPPSKENDADPIIIKQTDGNTAYYGYLSRYATEIKKNAPIKQGQIIGYTNKRLEFKIIKNNNNAIDFYEIKRYPKLSLRGEERQTFLDSIRDLQDMLRDM